jgi:hypothetical protein
MLAFRLQERAFGGLDRESLGLLESFARHTASRGRHLKPGTVLVRDYQGQRHTVTVVPDGFDWQGRTYTSLSAIARAITGTAWSGPRFFALARPNGTSPARGHNKKRVRVGHAGSQPATGSRRGLAPHRPTRYRQEPSQRGAQLPTRRQLSMTLDRLRLSVADARDLAEGALRGIGYRNDEARSLPTNGLFVPDLP